MQGREWSHGNLDPCSWLSHRVDAGVVPLELSDGSPRSNIPQEHLQKEPSRVCGVLQHADASAREGLQMKQLFMAAMMVLANTTTNAVGATQTKVA